MAVCAACASLTTPHSSKAARVLLMRIIKCLLVGLSTFAWPDMTRQAMGSRCGAGDLRQQLIDHGISQRRDGLNDAAQCRVYLGAQGDAVKADDRELPRYVPAVTSQLRNQADCQQIVGTDQCTERLRAV